jgi:hypothetical protein
VAITLTRVQRDAIRDDLIAELGALSDLPMLLNQGDYAAARRLRQRVEGYLRLLDDLGWGASDPGETFELTMPLDQLERTIRDLQGSTAGSLSEHIRDAYENADTAYADALACSAYADVLRQLDAAADADEDEPEDEEDEEVVAVRSAGAAFAREWADSAADEQVRAALARFPTLPAALDADMLAAAAKELGSLRERPDLKADLRGTFWFTLRTIAVACHDCCNFAAA